MQNDRKIFARSLCKVYLALYGDEFFDDIVLTCELYEAGFVSDMDLRRYLNHICKKNLHIELERLRLANKSVFYNLIRENHGCI